MSAKSKAKAFYDSFFRSLQEDGILTERNAEILHKELCDSFMPRIIEVFKREEEERKNFISSLEGFRTFMYTTKKEAFEMPAIYMLVDASLLVPSHVPTPIGMGKFFKEDPRYPIGIQERRYHQDPNEVMKVRGNAKNFQPSLVMNTNPDAINGPPVVDVDFFVLGGNSRVMTQQLLYKEGRGKEITDFLKGTCQLDCFGFEKEDVERIRQPILVRRIDFKAKDNLQEARKHVRFLNETLMQELDYSSYIVAMAGKISPSVWIELAYYIANQMQENQTFKGFLRTNSAEFAQMLYKKGVLTDTQLGKYTVNDPLNPGLNREGVMFVENVMLGKVVKDPYLLDNLPPQIVENMQNISPYVMISDVSQSWSLSRSIEKTLRALLISIPKKYKLSEVLGQEHMKIMGDTAFSSLSSPMDKLVYHIFDAFRSKPLRFSSGFRKYITSLLKIGREEQARMFAMGSPEEEAVNSLASAFGMKKDKRSPSGFSLK